MIYGDPYKIALQFDIVKDWNLEGSSWVNGIFSVYINGNPFLFTGDNSTLNVWYPYYYSILHNEKFKSDDGIITKSKDYYDNLYKKIFNDLYGDEGGPFFSFYERVKGIFDLTVDPLSENKKYIFIILGKDDVILYGGRSKGNYIVLPQGTFINLLKDMHKYPLFSGIYIKWEDNYHYYANHEY